MRNVNDTQVLYNTTPLKHGIHCIYPWQPGGGETFLRDHIIINDQTTKPAKDIEHFTLVDCNHSVQI